MNEALGQHVDAHPYPLVFATLSGAHLYGFSSPDSDFDLRGVHLLPMSQVLGLKKPEDTVTTMYEKEGLEIDLVTHDLEKFIKLMLTRNGLVLEQLYSPHVLFTSPEHEELKRLGKGCITRNHAHHYFGFSRSKWSAFMAEEQKCAKTLLYVFRALLTGIHLMKSGEIEANLTVLQQTYGYSWLCDLIKIKQEGQEKGPIPSPNTAFYEQQFQELLKKMEEARNASTLPENPSSEDGLSDFLVQVRLTQIDEARKS